MAQIEKCAIAIPDDSTYAMHLDSWGRKIGRCERGRMIVHTHYRPDNRENAQEPRLSRRPALHGGPDSSGKLTACTPTGPRRGFWNALDAVPRQLPEKCVTPVTSVTRAISDVNFPIVPTPMTH